MQTCHFYIIVSWLWLYSHVSVGVFLRACSVLLQHLFFGLLSGDYLCKIIICHYCFFCMYYFNVVHVFYVMRDSPTCDIFYCIIILKAICLLLKKIEKLEYLCHSCGFPCQQRVLKAFSNPGYLRSDDGVV